MIREIFSNSVDKLKNKTNMVETNPVEDSPMVNENQKAEVKLSEPALIPQGNVVTSE
jgi:hypothetical protein